jgi:hypothetical protein
MIRRVKSLALLFFVVLQFGCTTLANRRDLYSPQPAPDSYEARRQLISKPAPTPEPKPQLRG